MGGLRLVRLTLLFTLSLIILVSQHTQSPIQPFISSNGSSHGFSASYEQRQSIDIVGDSDFVDQGWPGNGTEDAPFIIEGFEIVDSDLCISIALTSVHFVIRDCILRSDSYASCIGVSLNNVENARIENCTFQMIFPAIWIHSSSNCIIDDILVEEGSVEGVRIIDSSHCVVRRSTFSNCGGRGVLFEYFSSSTDCILVENTFKSSDIELSSVNNLSLTDNLLVNSELQVRDSENINILNNSLRDFGGYLLRVIQSHSVVIIGNTFEAQSAGRIRLSSCTSCSIQGNELSNTVLQIRGEEIQNWAHSIEDNLVNGKPIGYFYNQISDVIDLSDYAQIILVACDQVILHQGEFEQTSYPIQVAFSQYCIITENTFSLVEEGITIRHSTACEIRQNTFSGLNYDAIGIYHSSSCIIEDNTLTCDAYSYSTGMGLYNVLNTIIRDNRIIGIGVGIGIYESHSVIVSDNKISECMNAVQSWGSNLSEYSRNHFINISSTTLELYNSRDCTIISNTVEDAMTGFSIINSQSSLLYNNTLVNLMIGIGLRSSLALNLTENTLQNCGLEINGELIEYWVHDLEGNTVNGLPIGYILHESDRTLDGSQYGQVILIDCMNVSVLGGSFASATAPIQMCYCNRSVISDFICENGVVGVTGFRLGKCTFKNITVLSTSIGIRLHEVQTCQISQCVFNTFYIGIDVYSASNITIMSTSIIDTDHAIEVYDTVSVEITKNLIRNCSYDAIKLYDCNASTITNNTIDVCGYTGIYVSQCPSCVISENNLFEVISTAIHVYMSDFAIVDANTLHGIGCGTGIHSSRNFQCVISLNQIQSHYTGISIYESSEIKVTENSLSDSLIGLFIDSDFATFTDNQFVNTGVLLTQAYSHLSFAGNQINGNELGYFEKINGQTIESDQYGQIILNDCENIHLEGGEYNSCTAGVSLINCDSCIVSDFTLSNNYRGLYCGNSLGCTVSSTTMHDNDIAFEIRSSDSMTVSKNRIYDNRIGIQTSNVVECEIIFNRVERNRDCGIWLDGEDCHVEWNTLTNNKMGVRLNRIEDVVLRHNTLENNGFVFSQAYGKDFVIENNTVNKKPLGFFHVEQRSIDRTEYGQIVLFRSNMSSVLGGDYRNATVGVELVECANCSVNGVSSSENAIAGIQVYRGANCSVIGNTLTRNSYGVNLESSEECAIIENDCSHNVVGIYDFHGTRTHVNWNTLHDCETGLLVHEGTYSNISRNAVWGCSVGISLSSFLSGWWWSYSYNCTVQNNLVHHNTHAIQLDMASHCTISHNSVFSNTGVGIHLNSTSYYNDIFENKIGWNNMSNALDYGYENTWNDDFSQGNSWSDFDGSVPYMIEGTADSADWYPTLLDDTTAPLIEPCPDISIFKGTSGNRIVWTVYEELPDRLSVLLDGVELLSGRWNNTRIVVSVDNLDLGVHTLSLEVIDLFGHTSMDTVLVHVSVYVDLSAVSVVSVILIEAFLAVIIVVFMRPSPPTPSDPVAELRGE